MTLKEKNIENKEKNSIRDFVDAANVGEYFLYRKDGYVLSYLRIYPFNLDLIPKVERRAIAQNLAASFQNDQNNFIYFTLPREIDLDRYKSGLKNRYAEEIHLGKRHILAGMMLEATNLSTSGENYEHQHFVKIWRYGKDKRKVEEALLERIRDFKSRFDAVNIKTEILREADIIKLCNLFGNSLQASYEITEKDALYTPMMLM